MTMASNLMAPDSGAPYLSPPPGTLVKLRELESRPRDEQVLICTGSQGEPMAALSRIARGEHNHTERPVIAGHRAAGRHLRTRCSHRATRRSPTRPPLRAGQ